ncbi:MAG: tetratricopeptide repeat protein [Proteobacteria bacterium]|nr:tetratricopeptide repeat protein [Pseudomonadota bacterium]
MPSKPQPSRQIDESERINWSKMLVEACEAELLAGPDNVRTARLHFEIGQAYDTQLGDPKLALEHYRSCLGLIPDHVPSIRGAIRLLLSKQDYPGAVELYDAEIKISSNPHRKAELYFAKGRVIEELVLKPQEARKCYATAATLDPSNPSILKAVERTAIEAGSWSELAAAYEQTSNAITSDLRHQAAVYVERAQLCETRLKKTTTATELYEAALELDPFAGRALEALKRLLHAQSRWQDLIQVLEYEVAQAKEPEDRAMALFRMGRIYDERLGIRKKAIEALSEAAEVLPTEPLILEELIRLYEYESGDDPKALIETLQRLVETVIRPEEKLGLLHRIGQLCDDVQNDPESALQWYESALAIDQTYLPAIGALEKIYSRGEMWKSLIKMHLGEAGATVDTVKRADAYARVAGVFEIRLNRPEEAIKYHDLALGLSPELEGSFKSLTRLHVQAKNHRKLAELYERAIDRAKENDVAIAYLFKIGQIYEEYLDDPQRAIHEYRRILKLQTGHLGAIHAIQRACEAAGRHSEFVEALQIEVELTSDKARKVALLHRAGEVLDDNLDDMEAALDRYRAVKKLDSKYPPVLSRLGRLYQRMGRSEDLLEIYREEVAISEKGPAKVALLHKMGELCEQQIGDEDKAIDYYRKAIVIDSTYGPCLKALSRMLRRREDWKGLVDVLETELSGLYEPKSKARILYRMAEVYEVHLKDMTRASSAYKKAISELPGYRPALDGQARVGTQLGQWDELVEQLKLEGGSAKDPHLAVDALLRAGEILNNQLGRSEEAIRIYETILEEQPDNIVSFLSLEKLYRSTSSFEKLANLYEIQSRILTDTSARVAAMKERVRLLNLHGIGNETDIRNAYLAILSLSPEDSETLWVLERMAVENKDRELLAEVDSRLAATVDDQRSAAVYRTRFGQSVEGSKPEEASQAYREALSKETAGLAAIRGLGRIAELTDNAEGIAQAFLGEANWTKRDDVAAELLTKSAAIRLERLGDSAGAIEEIALALERCPEHRAAASKLTELLLDANDIDRLIELLSQAAQAAKDVESKGELWRSIALLYADAKEDLPAAITALNRMVRLQPDHVPTMLQLVDLLKRNSQWNEISKTLERVVASKPSDELLIKAHLELAHISLKYLKDRKRAVVNTEALLHIDPFHKEALGLLVNLRAEEGKTKEAITAALRLVETVKDRDETALALLRLGQLEMKGGTKENAAKAFEQAVSITGPTGAAAVEYKRLLGSEEPWKNYAKALIDYLSEVKKSDSEDTDLLSSFFELASVQHEKLEQTDKAITTLNKGIKILGWNPLLGFELGKLMQVSDRNDKAIAEFQKIISADPAHSDAWRALAGALKSKELKDEAGIATAPLVVLQEASKDEYSVVQHYHARPEVARSGSLGKRSLQAIGPRSEGDSKLHDLVLSLREALAKLYPLELDRYGLTGRDRVTEGSPLRVLSDRLAKIFNVSGYDLYMHHSPAQLISVEIGQVPTILVQSRVTELSTPQQIFLLARALVSITRGLYPVAKLGSSELGLVLAAAVHKFSPTDFSWKFDMAELKKLHKQITKSTPRRSRKYLEKAVTNYVKGSETDLESCVQAIELTSTRVAALLAGDLPACVEILRSEDSTLSQTTGKKLVRNSAVIADLLSFWASKPALELRHKAGIL